MPWRQTLTLHGSVQTNKNHILYCNVLYLFHTVYFNIYNVRALFLDTFMTLSMCKVNLKSQADMKFAHGLQGT